MRKPSRQVSIDYTRYVREKIVKAIRAASEGRVVPHEEVKKRFLPCPSKGDQSV